MKVLKQGTIYILKPNSRFFNETESYSPKDICLVLKEPKEKNKENKRNINGQEIILNSLNGIRTMDFSLDWVKRCEGDIIILSELE